MSDQTWSIGELAEEFNTTLRTIRFYEDRGLLTPQRQGTARIFHDRDRVRLQLILRGKRLGLASAVSLPSSSPTSTSVVTLCWPSVGTWMRR